MFSPDDTIVAIATPAGRGGLGVVRISGSQAQLVAERILDRGTVLAPRYATFTKALHAGAASDQPLDSVVATWFPAPGSYTGEDVVEISAHGSPVVLQAIVRGAIDAGARLARPGEFTLRSYLHGKMDLVQAEAVADLIDAVTPLQARVAYDQLEGTLTTRIAGLDQQLFELIARLEASLDFPDEGYHFIEPEMIATEVSRTIDDLDAILGQSERGRIIRDGATVVIAGRPNVGKSSLFNALLGQARAIVAESPGTTRDLVSETCDLDGLKVTLVDTAGIRDAIEAVEMEGVRRGAYARAAADLVIVVLDASQMLTADDHRLLDDTLTMHRLVVANKSDRQRAWHREEVVCVSAMTGQGLEGLRDAITFTLAGDGGEMLCDSALISNVRHTTLLEQARGSLVRARAASETKADEEFVLSDLHAARASLGEVVGGHLREDVLSHIFERFCIGK